MDRRTDIEGIWAQYRSGLMAFLQSRVSNPADVVDLMQETLIMTHTKLPALNAQTSLRP
ncbi:MULTISPECIES: hypothetical protein [unclassified Pseudophaeobacter]|uniref:hypothetical protein n=1 Tax=unclassified Pseudophaeobacter TaxID=2637024 RepID=UPI0013C4FDC1|nr:hypothetical protein [Pseudophaeobacter sp. EL27]